MAFISLQRERADRMHIVRARRGNVRELGYQVTTYYHKASNKNISRISFILSADLQVKSGYRAGDYVDCVYDPKTKEGYLAQVDQGGWRLSPTSKHLNCPLKVQFPFFEDLGFPVTEHVVEIPDVHVKPTGIIFNLSKIVGDKKK